MFNNKFYKQIDNVIWYDDDTFVLLSSLNQAEKFEKYLSSKHPNINFSLEEESYGRLSFLDIFRKKVKFINNVYRKNTFSGVSSNFNICVLETCKIGLVKSLLLRCFNLCSDFLKFHYKINILNSILYKNS